MIDGEIVEQVEELLQTVDEAQGVLEDALALLKSVRAKIEESQYLPFDYE